MPELAVMLFLVYVVKGKNRLGILERFLRNDNTTAFNALTNRPETITDAIFKAIERYIVVMYSRTCPYNSVNGARRYIFSQGPGH